jgi:hypothetical protein
MPTWCGNLLTVTGPRYGRDRLVEQRRASDAFERTLSMPASVSTKEMPLTARSILPVRRKR